jgi:hypothetical protein
MCNRDIKLYNCMFTAESFGLLTEKLNRIPGVSNLLNPNYEGFMHAHLELQERSAVTTSRGHDPGVSEAHARLGPCCFSRT